MCSDVHRGVVQPNGLVDTSQSLPDTAVFKVRPVDDAFHLPSLDTGNFEWWYFDVLDARQGYVLKLTAHLGTDPLRTRCFPTVAVAARTPHSRIAVIQPFVWHDVQAAREVCDVKIQDAFHVWMRPSCAGATYHLMVRLPDFSATLQFRSQLPGWKPLGDAVSMQRGSKHAAFSWVIPLPRAEVVGTFSLAGVRYELAEALGYHDHNVWQVDPTAELFMDQAISQWQWGRFLGQEATVVFMNTVFRTHSLQSCLLATDSSIMHSSNNLVQVVTEQVTQDKVLRAWYPSRLTITLPAACGDLHMLLQATEVIDRRDLLAGVPPVVQWIVKFLRSHPAYYGLLADATLRIGGRERHGAALYEAIRFRSTRQSSG